MAREIMIACRAFACAFQSGRARRRAQHQQLDVFWRNRVRQTFRGLPELPMHMQSGETDGLWPPKRNP